MRLLSPAATEQIAGGFDVVCEYPLPGQFFDPNAFLIEQFFYYKMGQPSLFGANPDSQLSDPLPVSG